MFKVPENKYRKSFKGRNRGLARRGNRISFGDFAIQAISHGELTAKQIEAARRCISRTFKRGGKIWIRVYPNRPVTHKPLGVRQGKGKGDVEYWVFNAKPGTIIFEFAGINKDMAKRAFKLACAKLPVKAHFISRIVM